MKVEVSGSEMTAILGWGQLLAPFVSQAVRQAGDNPEVEMLTLVISQDMWNSSSYELKSQGFVFVSSGSEDGHNIVTIKKCIRQPQDRQRVSSEVAALLVARPEYEHYMAQLMRSPEKSS